MKRERARKKALYFGQRSGITCGAFRLAHRPRLRDSHVFAAVHDGIDVERWCQVVCCTQLHAIDSLLQVRVPAQDDCRNRRFLLSRTR
jgi:hypothetical protein